MENEMLYFNLKYREKANNYIKQKDLSDYIVFLDFSILKKESINITCSAYVSDDAFKFEENIDFSFTYFTHAKNDFIGRYEVKKSFYRNLEYHIDFIICKYISDVIEKLKEEIISDVIKDRLNKSYISEKRFMEIVKIYNLIEPNDSFCIDLIKNYKGFEDIIEAPTVEFLYYCLTYDSELLKRVDDFFKGEIVDVLELNYSY